MARLVIIDGLGSSDFSSAVPDSTARAVVDATAVSHHPAHAAKWRRPEAAAALNDICTLLINGLEPW
ncbi:hypothetical protein [Actinomadura opuntiae]|uniref:hypothetical protein n=1 Tax=Actinomadura sp. OS1-43 TaxID=604315 RepID=UPI00255AA8C1|nr:hypothetical protein [Actinomadura sp. OS1-43]MDL4813267.1 hypothetical protein [Actinomadura sp. OS1-43]